MIKATRCHIPIYMGIWHLVVLQIGSNISEYHTNARLIYMHMYIYTHIHIIPISLWRWILKELENGVIRRESMKNEGAGDQWNSRSRCRSRSKSKIQCFFYGVLDHGDYIAEEACILDGMNFHCIDSLKCFIWFKIFVFISRLEKLIHLSCDIRRKHARWCRNVLEISGAEWSSL